MCLFMLSEHLYPGVFSGLHKIMSPIQMMICLTLTIMILTQVCVADIGPIEFVCDPGRVQCVLKSIAEGPLCMRGTIGQN